MFAKKSVIVVLILLCINALNAQKIAKKDIVKVGNYKVLYPTRSQEIAVSIVHSENDAKFPIEKDGQYILESERNKDYKIYFRANGGKLDGNITIVNFRPGDSTIIGQENGQFQWSKNFLNKKLRNELTYKGDSLFDYVNRYDGGMYAGTAKLTKHGFRNIENKEFGANLLLKTHKYWKENIYYEDFYTKNILEKRKFTKNGENTVLLFTDDKIVVRLLFIEKDGKYSVSTYDGSGKLIKTHAIDQAEFQKEFPPAVSNLGE